jgi:chorismate-pyruvate lyase
MALVTAAALHAALLASDSATTVLERICQAPIRIRRLAVPPPAPTPIALPSGPRMEHRRVALVCGNTALSEADLWFLPDLLTPAMVRALAETDEPFGRVVQALSLRRTTLEACQFGPDAPVVLEHRALLCTKAGEAVAEVWERYGRSLVSAS